MRLFYGLCVMTLILGLGAERSYAQMAPEGERYLATLRSASQRQQEANEDFYFKMLHTLKSSRGENVISSVNGLRNYFPMMRFYTPFSESVIERMTALAFTVDTSDDRAAVNAAILNYEKILGENIVNFDVLDFAITMAQLDVRLGDVSFLNKVRRGLADNIARFAYKNDSPRTAFPIVTYADEAYILGTIGGTLKRSEVYEVGGKVYNVHDIIMPDGAYKQVYLDATKPISGLKQKKQTVERLGAWPE